MQSTRGGMETSCRIFFRLVRDSFMFLSSRLAIRFRPWQHHAHQEQEKRPMFHDTLLRSFCTLPEHTVTSSFWITADYPERSARNADAAFASETGLKKPSQLKYPHPLRAPSSTRAILSEAPSPAPPAACISLTQPPCRHSAGLAQRNASQHQVCFCYDRSRAKNYPFCGRPNRFSDSRQHPFARAWSR